jgi:hypothetical protein
MIYKFIALSLLNQTQVRCRGLEELVPQALDVEPKMGQHIELELPDSDPRAVAYVMARHQTPGATLPMAPPAKGLGSGQEGIRL